MNRGIGPDEPIIFGNEYFQRDNADLMVNMRSITAASIRKRESDLLRHMLASKKRALMSLDGASNAAYQDSKHLNMNASRGSAANAMASQQRFGSGFSTDLGHLDNQSLQMMYQSLTNKSVGSGENVINPILSDAMSQMNNSSYNFNGGPSQPQEFNAMRMLNNASNPMMAGSTSNYMSHMSGQNGGGGMIEANSGSGSSRMNNGRVNNSYGNMFPSESMYGSASNRANGGFSLSQQYNNGGPNENTTRKSFMNGKHSFHGNGASHENGNYGGYSNMPMNMNFNQHFSNLSSSTGTAGGSEEMYFSGQQF